MSASVKSRPATQSIIEPVLGERWVLTPGQMAVCAWFCVFFMYLNYIPLFHSDIWCHVHYGEWMLEHGKLVEQDPFLPLAEGMRVVNNAWLSQIVLAAAHRLGGPQFLSNLFAIVVLLGYAIYARVFYLLTGRKALAMAATLLLLLAGWTRHAIIRPEIFGGLFTAMLFWMLMRTEPWRSRTAAFDASEDDRFPRYFWIAVPLLFALWANLHGSFAVGLVILACHAAGQVLESAWRTRSAAGVVSDPAVRRWVWLTELAVAGSLLNPYGIDLLIETARFGRNPNLRDVLEWFPLRLIDFEGIQFLLGLGVTFGIVRHSRVRFRAAEVLMLLFFTITMASTVRMIGWLAPIWVIAMAPHLRDLWLRCEPHLRRYLAARRAPGEAANADEHEEDDEPFELPKFTFTLVSALLIWCAFALSPISQNLLSSKQRPLEQIVSKGTPRGVSEYFRKHPPAGMVWAPQWWGDWLAWDGPSQLQVFMTTTVHLAPHHVWRDYMSVAQARAGWDRILQRYAVNTLVVDKELSKKLHNAVRSNPHWKVAYQDKRGAVYQRLGALPSAGNGKKASQDAARTASASPTPPARQEKSS